MRYRASRPIAVLAFRDNHDLAIPIPVGKIFEAVGPASDDRFTIVAVHGEEFLVFNSDLTECCGPVLAQPAAQPIKYRLLRNT